MPVDTARQSIEVDASLDQVLGTLRDVESQPEWIPEIISAELLEVYADDDLPATARFSAEAPVGKDQYTLAYEHGEDSMSWSMVQGRLQTGQEGEYTLQPRGPRSTQVTYQLTIHHNLPLPGFLRNRVIQGLVGNTLKGLKTRLENGDAASAS